MTITINGTGTVTGVSVGGLPDGIVDTDMLANDAVATAKIANDAVDATKIGSNTFVSYAIICDQKAQNTHAGTFTSGAWRTRDLNTEISDADGIVAIASNQFTLGAGTYLIEWAAPGCRCNTHVARLFDITGDAAVQLGKNAFADTSVDGDQTDATGSARVTITANNTYEIQHQCTSTSNTFGLGLAHNLGAEIYTVVKIFKEA